MKLHNCKIIHMEQIDKNGLTSKIAKPDSSRGCMELIHNIEVSSNCKLYKRASA
jgi:hypothetical protein